MSKTPCAARCSRGSVQGVLRAPAEGEGGVAPRENLSAAASATLERSAGTVARGRRASGVAVAPRSHAAGAPAARAAGAPWEARARAARVQTADEDLWWVVVVVAATPNYRRLASPDRSGEVSTYPLHQLIP